MIDMHSHCLPFIDDGADSIETSLKMLEDAKRLGADIVAATPHCMLKNISAADFAQRRNDSLSAVIKEIGGNCEKYPKVVCGAEVFLGYDIADCHDLKLLCYGDTDYILLELSQNVSASVVSEWIYNVSIKGLKPVIAHIDRHPLYREVMAELSGIDVVYQINAARFLGLFSSGPVKDIVRRHDKFIVGSDMHNLTTRPFNLHEALKKAKRILPHGIDMMFDKGARSMLFDNRFEI